MRQRKAWQEKKRNNGHKRIHLEIQKIKCGEVLIWTVRVQLLLYQYKYSLYKKYICLYKFNKDV